MKRPDCHVSNCGNIVASYAVLHNIRETFGDGWLPERIKNFPSSALHSSHCQDDGNVDMSTCTILDAIASYMYSSPKSVSNFTSQCSSYLTHAGSPNT